MDTEEKIEGKYKSNGFINKNGNGHHTNGPYSNDTTYKQLHQRNGNGHVNGQHKTNAVVRNTYEYMYENTFHPGQYMNGYMFFPWLNGYQQLKSASNHLCIDILCNIYKGV